MNIDADHIPEVFRRHVKIWESGDLEQLNEIVDDSYRGYPPVGSAIARGSKGESNFSARCIRASTSRCLIRSSQVTTSPHGCKQPALKERPANPFVCTA